MALCLPLFSCLDLDAKVTIGQDGSTRLSMRYAISKMVASLDAVSEDERILPFPATRAALEARLQGIPGASLVSFAQKSTQDDIVTDAELAFPSPAALAAFVDPQGERARYEDSGGSKSLALVLWKGTKDGTALDADLTKLVDASFAPYSVKLAITLPRPASSSNLGSKSQDGRTLSYSSSIPDLVKKATPVAWEFHW
jgi:hypothetical protein